MFTLVWMLRLGWELRRPGQEAATLVQPPQLHIVPKNQDKPSASSWNTCWLPESLSETTTTETPTYSHATTIAVMSSNRLNTSCHQTSVCFFEDLLLIDHGFGSLGIHSCSRNRGKRETIGWTFHDHDRSNGAVRANLNEERWLVGSGATSQRQFHLTFFVFTDGSDREMSRKRQRVGWGFAAMKTSPRHGDKRLVEACGRVRISTGDEFCVGATRATNNTGEMQGLIEALSWPITCVEQGALQACSA